MPKQRNVIAQLQKYLKEDPELVYSCIPQLPEEQQENARIMCVILEEAQSLDLAKLCLQMLERDIQAG